MNPAPLYHVLRTLVEPFSLEVRNRRVLLDFSLAMLATCSCELGQLAHALQPRGGLESQYRRLQRFLANRHIEVAPLQTEWARMVLAAMQADELKLLVDETSLSDHLKVMVLGVWGKDGCVPLAWRCYAPGEYPPEGQVALIADLLKRVMPVIGFGTVVWVLADRGIGTSPALVQAVETQGARVLFRVQGTTRFRDLHGREQALKRMAVRGKSWQSVGEVFKKAGWLPAQVTVAWDEACAQPWCLVSSAPVTPDAYAVRFDQEVSFRDAKSDGFGWNKSHIWLPSHAERLLLVLALCYWLIISIGQRISRPTRGRASRWSAFRRGLEALAAFFRPTIAPFLAHLSAPSSLSPPLFTCVVQ
jgi:hypothetical protein